LAERIIVVAARPRIERRIDGRGLIDLLSPEQQAEIEARKVSKSSSTLRETIAKAKAARKAMLYALAHHQRVGPLGQLAERIIVVAARPRIERRIDEQQAEIEARKVSKSSSTLRETIAKAKAARKAMAAESWTPWAVGRKDHRRRRPPTNREAHRWSRPDRRETIAKAKAARKAMAAGETKENPGKQVYQAATIIRHA
jgi:hypothetical protein